MLTRRNLLSLLAAGTALGGMSAIGAGPAQAQAAIPDMTLGDPNAPVTVVEYASFTCPHCANFHADTFKAFKAEYIDTGKVHFIYREVYFDRYGLWASMVARCAGPDRFFGVAELLYASQGEWARQADATAVAGALKRVGLQAGLSQADVDACFADAAQAEGLYAWYQMNTERDNVRSTPSFLINGEMHSGNMSLSQIGRLVDDASS